MRMNKQKKGQAALEFLTTYGWAFLVILIMIAALAYFGVLSPQNFLPERCNLAAGWTCNDFLLSTNTNGVQMQLDISNQLGESVTISNIAFVQSDGIDATAPVSCSAAPTALGASMATGTGTVIDCVASMANPVPAGERQRVAFDINATKGTSSFNKLYRGEVFGAVQ